MFSLSGRFRERTRPTPNRAKVVLGKWRYIINGVYHPEFDLPSNTVTASSGPFIDHEMTWDRVNPGPPYRDGGSFSNLKVFLDPYTVQARGTYMPYNVGPSSGHQLAYVGGFSNPLFNGDLTPLSSYMTIGETGNPFAGFLLPDITGLGPEAYRRMRPQLEIAGASQFLGEARDIPRMLKTTAKGFHGLWKELGDTELRDPRIHIRGRKARDELRMTKTAGDQFINSQFGWVPFVNDLINFDKVVQDSNKYVARISEKNGQWDKRHTVLSETTSTDTLWDAGGMGVWPAGQNVSYLFRRDGTGSQVLPWIWTTVETTQRLWASGQFKYYRPEFDSNLSGYNSAWSNVQRHLMLLGARINPSVLYKITPWSWLADWMTTLGTNIDNATARMYDSSLSRNLFIMAHSQKRIKFTQMLPFVNGSQHLTWYRNVESKLRREGGPYGLGWSSNNLSARQIAILTALGIARV